jgi:GST-like protein
MIDFYFWPTPNGWKVSIMLEETGLPYTLKPVNIGAGDQFKPGDQPERPDAGDRR